MKNKFCFLVVIIATVALGFNSEYAHGESNSLPTSIQNARVYIELSYTTEDGYSDICKEKIIAEVLKKEKYNCRSSKDGYVIFKKGISKNVPCIDMNGFSGIATKKPNVSSKVFSCGESKATTRWLSNKDKLDIAVTKRHDWSTDTYHKYYQQVFWELRGETYSWKYDLNGGSYLGVCKHKDLGKGYIAMMKADGLKNIECGDSKNWFYIKATMPNGWAFCLNRNDLDNNDSKEDMEDCAEVTKAKFTNVVKAR